MLRYNSALIDLKSLFSTPNLWVFSVYAPTLLAETEKQQQTSFTLSSAAV